MTAPVAVVVLPYPANGHVTPLLSLARLIAAAGTYDVSFLTTEHDHRRLINSTAGTQDTIHGAEGVRFVPVSDGLPPEADRDDLVRLTPACRAAMSEFLERAVLGAGGRRCWVVVDVYMAWAIDVVLAAAAGCGVRVAAVCPSSAALFATLMSVPMLIGDGIIGADGSPQKTDTFSITGGPPADETFLAWNYLEGYEHVLFNNLANCGKVVSASGVTVLCNSFADIEPDIFITGAAAFPTFLPVGPLPPIAPAAGLLTGVDNSCLPWLDAQPAGAVVYAAFGSSGVLGSEQVEELIAGLELSGAPFLLVSRADDAAGGAAGEKGKVVTWAPQVEVLAHAAVGCFVSHCGWNSTIDGVCGGAPFVCWPCGGDQFMNERYICDVWKVGVRARAGARGGLVTRQRVAELVNGVLGDEEMRGMARRLREAAERSAGEGGQSATNLRAFIDAMSE